jgi:hypothetical protein
VPKPLINRKIKINIARLVCVGGVFASDAEGWMPSRAAGYCNLSDSAEADSCH